MPSTFSYEYRNDSPRIAAWMAHYVANGCHPIKAAKVAWQKCRNSSTWPRES